MILTDTDLTMMADWKKHCFSHISYIKESLTATLMCLESRVVLLLGLCDIKEAHRSVNKYYNLTNKIDTVSTNVECLE